jgi:ABC-2 type transport system permease protein
MFLHIFKYRFISLLRDRSMIFWTMIFPLVLATFFKLSLGNIGENEKFYKINIAVIDNVQYKENVQFQETIQSLSEGEKAMFNLMITDEITANKQLLEGEIIGYIFVEEPLRAVFKQSGMYQSIVKVFLDQYSQSTSAITTVVSQNPAVLQDVLDIETSQTEFTQEKAISKANPDSVVMYFYSLIAMACFFGSFFGLREVTHIQADLSVQGARMNMSPVHKLKAFLYSSFSSLVIHFGVLLILMVYIVFGLQISFGTRTGLVILTVFLGCIVGISFGALIAVVVKGSENVKVGICIGVSNFGSFLAGMMVTEMKYLVSEKFPLLSYINPVNVLADSLYALYYYDSYERYTLNMVLLVIFSILFCLITYATLRRKKYASI